MKTIQAIIYFIYEKRFTLSKAISPTVLIGLMLSTWNTHVKYLKLEQSNNILNSKVSELQQQSIEKDRIIEKLIAEIKELHIQLKEAQQWSINTPAVSQETNTADIIIAQNEMTQFWVMTGFKVIIALTIIIGTYSIVKRFSIMPVSILTGAVNTVTENSGWFKGDHKFYFDRETGSRWIVELENDQITKILVNLCDTPNFVPVTDYIIKEPIPSVYRLLNETALIAANPANVISDLLAGLV